MSQLAAKDKRVGLVGILKDAGDDNVNILELSQNYFKYPLFMDEKWHVYKAMGGRTLTMETLKAGVQKYMPRYKRKGIEMRLDGGDRFMMGGVLLFDRKGDLCFSYEEAYGEELDMQVIERAIAEIRGEGSNYGSSSTSSLGDSVSAFSTVEEHRFI